LPALGAGKRKGKEEEPKRKKIEENKSREEKTAEKAQTDATKSALPKPRPALFPILPFYPPLSKENLPRLPSPTTRNQARLGSVGLGNVWHPNAHGRSLRNPPQTLLTLPSLPSPVSAHPHPRVSNPRVSLRIESENPKKPPGAEPIAWGEISSSPDNPNAPPKTRNQKKKGVEDWRELLLSREQHSLLRALEWEGRW